MKKTEDKKPKHIVKAATDHGIVDPSVEKQPSPEVSLGGIPRDRVATASGYAHALARNLDLMTGGIMVGVGHGGFVKKLKQEIELAKRVHGALIEAVAHLEGEQAEGSAS